MKTSRKMTLGEIAEKVGGSVQPIEAATMLVSGVAPIETAVEGTVTFVSRQEYLPKLEVTKASAVIVRDEVQTSLARLIHPEPYIAFAKVAQLFHSPPRPAPGIDKRAFVHTDAEVHVSAAISAGVSIAAGAVIEENAVIHPGVCIGEGVRVGKGTEIHANVVVEYGCVIGKHVIIHAGTVIGGDGFGFAPSAAELVKIPQAGIVVIEDWVELGANCSIDRATMGETRIGLGTKLDSAVHVGHNAHIGKHCLLCGHVAVAGSAKIGDWCVLAGKAAIKDNITICDRVIIGAKTGVIRDIDKPGTYLGYPAIPAKEWHRNNFSLSRVKELESRLRALEAHFGSREGK